MFKNYILVLLLTALPLRAQSDVRVSDFENEAIKLNYSKAPSDSWLDKTLNAKTINENQELIAELDCKVREYDQYTKKVIKESVDNVCLSLKLSSKERQRVETQNSYKNLLWSIFSLPLGLRVLK